MKFPRFSKQQWIVATLPLVLLALFYLVRTFIAAEWFDARAQAAALHSELDSALSKLGEAQARIAVLERETDVLRRANALLRESERVRQDEIADLEADLAFYRRLGGASGSQAPLAVHYLEIQATESPRVYRLIMTLTQNLRWAAVISGRVELGLEGIQDGAAAQLTGKQLLPAAAQPIQFRFKYFQQLERLVTLPEGFTPSRLTVRLRAAGLRQAVERAGEWQDLFNRDGDGQEPESPGAPGGAAGAGHGD